MKARLRVKAAVPSGRRQRKEFGATGSLAQASEGLITARLRRMAAISARERTGLTALFSGPPGTGKTMATALARSLGRALYRIGPSVLSESYIGETEKNLSRLFANAREQNAVLFFDEADALFGKRTAVEDSHDSYANLEVGHLLARMRRHRGVVILGTNARTEIDPAVSRRFDAVVTVPGRYPAPETA